MQIKRRRKRITYKALTNLADEWNRESGFTEHDQPGHLIISNDGNVHWLSQRDRKGSYRNTHHTTDGTIRSCYQALQSYPYGTFPNEPQ